MVKEEKIPIFVVALSFAIAVFRILHGEYIVCFVESAFVHTLHHSVLSITLPFRKREEINPHVMHGIMSRQTSTVMSATQMQRARELKLLAFPC